MRGYFSTLSTWASGPRKVMKNGHSDVQEPIRAIPFNFSASTFWGGDFSSLRLFH